MPKKKAGTDYGRLYLSNCVTLTTRVRIDILRAIARKYTSETEDLFVSAFASRPVLQVRKKIENQRTLAFTFVDAISKYGAGMREADLGEAYKRAGTAFNGQLQQNFVVLHDGLQGGAAGGQGSSGTTRWTAQNAPKKRARDGEGQSTSMVMGSPAKVKRIGKKV